MKRYIDMREDAEESNSWTSVSYILAGSVLVIIVLLISGMAFFGRLSEGNAQQGITESVGTSLSGEDASNGESDSIVESGNDDVLGALEAREAALKNREAEFAAKEQAVVELASARKTITEELAAKFKELGIVADIDADTGNIRFGEALLFEVNKTALNANGEAFLRKLVPAYLSVVFSEKNRNMVEQIIIEGHADDGGSYSYNLDLSQKRSFSVADFIIKNQLVKLADGSDVEKLLAISGKSFSSPVMVNGTVDRKLSRRVELVFRLKYDGLLDSIRKALGDGN